MKRLVVMLLLTLLLVSCGLTATPRIVKETVEVTREVEVTRIVEVPPKPAVTATLVALTHAATPVPPTQVPTLPPISPTDTSTPIATSVPTIKQRSVLLPAEFFPDVEDQTRFLVFQDENGDRHFATDTGFYGGFVTFSDEYIYHGRVFSVGAQYVLTGTVDGFLGYRFESLTDFPLVFRSERDGLRYVCGRGSVSTPEGKVFEFTGGNHAEWISKLKKGDHLQRRAAAQALGWIGSVNDQQELLTTLADEDFLARGLAAEALMRIGDRSAIPALKRAVEDANIVIERLEEGEAGTADGSFVEYLDVSIKPFSSWREARFEISDEVFLTDDQTGKHMWLKKIYEAAIAEIEHRSTK